MISRSKNQESNPSAESNKYNKNPKEVIADQSLSNGSYKKNENFKSKTGSRTRQSTSFISKLFHRNEARLFREKRNSFKERMTNRMYNVKESYTEEENDENLQDSYDPNDFSDEKISTSATIELVNYNRYVITDIEEPAPQRYISADDLQDNISKIRKKKELPDSDDELTDTPYPTGAPGLVVAMDQGIALVIAGSFLIISGLLGCIAGIQTPSMLLTIVSQFRFFYFNLKTSFLVKFLTKVIRD